MTFYANSIGTCYFWLDPETYLVDVGGGVYRWTDRYAGIALLSNTPSITRVANAQNGLPVVFLPGGGAKLTQTTTAGISAAGGGPRTFVAVYKRPSVSDTSTILTQLCVGSQFTMAAYSLGMGGDPAFSIGGMDGLYSSNQAPDNGWRVVIAVYDGSTIEVYKNGAIAISEFATIGAPSAAGRLGAFYGYLGDVIVYNWALSAAQVATLSEQLAARWAISLNPPAVPTALDATVGTHKDKVGLTWTGDQNATSYQIFRSEINLDYPAPMVNDAVMIGTSDTASYDDFAAPIGWDLFYSVKAVGVGGVSAFSAPVTTAFRALDRSKVPGKADVRANVQTMRSDAAGYEAGELVASAGGAMLKLKN